MPSTQTIFRAVVMVVLAAVGVKGWRLYGPTNEQVKSVVSRGIEMAEAAVEGRSEEPITAQPDPHIAPRQGEASQLLASNAPALTLTQPAQPTMQAEAPKLLPDRGATPNIMVPAPAPSGGTGDRMPELMSRLQKMGAADTNLSPWGSEGHLYRFSCRAPLMNAPAMTQHFESVATEPAAAVEQVIAKMEAWQVAQRDGGTLRY
ncbi:MAG TPA: hypothetical protein VHU84_16765 [Lacipirellulaceae bacterium]|jgi:hypothetical protein|nr:hypothetical protein [Lacipirellulaceae bacterium]